MDDASSGEIIPRSRSDGTGDVGRTGRAARATVAVRRHLIGLIGHVRGLGVVVWAVLLVVAGVVFLVRERGDLGDLGRELRTAEPGWLVVAGAVQLVILALMGLQQHLVYRLLGHRLPYRLLLPLFLRRQMIATIVPGGAPLSLAIQVRRLEARGVPVSLGVFGEVVSASVGTVSFVALLIPVTLGLVVTGGASAAALAATGILTVLLVTICSGFVLALRPAGPPAWLDRRLPRRFRDGLDEARDRRVPMAGVLLLLSNALLIDLLGVLVLNLSVRSVAPGFDPVDALIGYTVGSAFLFITPIFGGLGIVELSMATALAARGLPASAALGSVLIYRAFELWLPLLLGVAAEPLVQRGAVGMTRGGVRAILPRLPAIAVAVSGALTVLSVLGPHGGHHRLAGAGDYWVLSVPSLARSATLVAGLLLLALAWGLWRRRRLAWFVAVACLLVATVAHTLKGHDVALALVTAATLLMLGLRRDDFRVRTAIPMLGGTLGAVGGSVVVALAYGTVGFWLLDRRDFGTDFGLRDAFRETVRLYLGMGRGDLVPRTHYAAWFLDSITVTGVTSIGVAAFALWRPLVWHHRTHPAELARARALIARYGDSSLDTFKGWDDKLFWFAPDDAGLVAFQLGNGCAIALGDPVVRDEEAFPAVLAGFAGWCDSNGWRYAFHQTTPARAGQYRRAGFRLLKVGEDAIVNVSGYSLDGPGMKGLRAATRRLERDGYVVRTHRPPHAAALIEQLREVSDAWLTIGGRRERGFTLGQWSDRYIAQCAVVALEDGEGRIVAFANLIGDGVPGEATIDLMRRREDAPNAAMDVLFAGIFLACRAAGFSAFSLGMVPWVAIGREPAAPAVERALAHLDAHMERFFAVSGLYAYKAKFRPRWEARYLAYPSDLDLPRITVAIVRLTERAPARLAGWAGRPDMVERAPDVPEPVLADTPANGPVGQASAAPACPDATTQLVVVSTSAVSSVTLGSVRNSAVH